MAKTTFTILKDIQSGKPQRAYLDFEVTYPDKIQEDAFSEAIGQVHAMVSIMWKAQRNVEGYNNYDGVPRLTAELYRDNTKWWDGELVYFFGTENPEDPPTPYNPPATIGKTFPVKWPVIGNGNASNLTIRIYDNYGETLVKEISVPVDTVNALPKIELPEGKNLWDYVTPSEGIPEGWPIIGNIPGSKMKFRFNVNDFVSYYTGASFSSGSVLVTPSYGTPSGVIPLVVEEGDSDGWMTAEMYIPEYAETWPTPPMMDPPTETSLSVVITDTNNLAGATESVRNDIEKYKKPVITSFIADRSDANGTEDEEGQFVKVRYSVNLFQPKDSDGNAIPPINTNTAILKIGETIIFDQTSEFNPDQDYIVDADLDPVVEYTIEIQAFDITGNGSSTVSKVLETAYCTVDFLSGGRGIAFGKVAEKEGFENDMESFFNKPLHIINGSLHVEKREEDSDVDVPSFEVDENGVMIIRTDEPNEFFKVDPVTRKITLSREQTQIVNASYTGGSWYQGRNMATVKNAVNTKNNAFYPLASMKSIDGDWCIGTLKDSLAFSYVKDTDYNASTNKNQVWYFTPDSAGLRGVSFNGKYLIDLIYPVGSIYMSAVNVSPASFAGGTWTALPNGYYLRSANGFSTGGANGHTHSVANSVGVCLTINTDKYVYARILKGNTWTANTWGGFTSMGTGSYSNSWYTEPYGNTQSTNHYPACQNVYAWRRTA